jgi:hypothetical protein
MPPQQLIEPPSVRYKPLAIGIIDPPIVRLKAIPEDELREGYEWMTMLSKDYGFKPGTIKSRSTHGYTKALSTGCIKAINRHKGIETTIPGGETYNAITGRSSDILGIIDAEIWETDPPRDRFIQACGRDDWQAHIRKMADYDHINSVRRCLANPTHQLEIWGWAQYPGFNKNGTRSKTKFWYPRVQIITLDFMLGHAPPQFARFWEA